MLDDFLVELQRAPLLIVFLLAWMMAVGASIARALSKYIPPLKRRSAQALAGLLCWILLQGWLVSRYGEPVGSWLVEGAGAPLIATRYHTLVNRGPDVCRVRVQRLSDGALVGQHAWSNHRGCDVDELGDAHVWFSVRGLLRSSDAALDLRDASVGPTLEAIASREGLGEVRVGGIGDGGVQLLTQTGRTLWMAPGGEVAATGAVLSEAAGVTGVDRCALSLRWEEVSIPGKLRAYRLRDAACGLRTGYAPCDDLLVHQTTAFGPGDTLLSSTREGWTHSVASLFGEELKVLTVFGEPDTCSVLATDGAGRLQLVWLDRRTGEVVTRWE